MKYIIALVAFVLLSVSAASADETIHVAAAANLEKVFASQIIPEFQKRTGITVVPSYGATKLLAKQLENGAPYEVFISADTQTVTQLCQEGDLDPKSQAVYVIGQLALWHRNDAKVAPKSLTDLTDPGIAKIAIANPKTAPYGAAAVQSLTKAGLLDTLTPKIVYAENIQQSLQFAQTGNADVSFTALSLVIGDTSGGYIIVPDDMHAPIAQALAVTPKASDAARTFAAFLTSTQAAEIWSRSGYRLPANRPDGLVALLAVFESRVCGDRHRCRCRSSARPSAQPAVPRTGIAEGFATLPLVLPPTVLGYFLLVSLGRKSAAGHFYERVFHQSLVFTWQGAALAAAIASLPLIVTQARVAFSGIEQDLSDAARVFGATESQVFWWISLPLARRGIIAGISLAFARALGDFGATLMVAGDIPGATQTMPLAIYDALQDGDTHVVLVFVVIASMLSIVFAVAASAPIARKVN